MSTSQLSVKPVLPFLLLLLVGMLGRSPVISQDLHVFNLKTPGDLQNLLRYTGDGLALISAHRGGAASGYPENCIATFEHTLRYTHALLEVDPRYTKDSAIVLHHDPMLDRTTTGQGRISDYTLEELKKLRLKDPDGKITNYQIPTLDEALEWAKGKTVLVLDQKDVPVVDRVRKIEEHGAEANAMLIVYSYENARQCFQLNPNIMMEVMAADREKLATFSKTGVPWRNVIAFVGHDPAQDLALYGELHGNGVLTMAGTSRNLDRQVMTGAVDDIQLLKDEYQQLLHRGVDMIETDIPVELSRVISTNHSNRLAARSKYFGKISKSAKTWKLPYPIVDTGQKKFFNNYGEIPEPTAAAPFYGQDAHYPGLPPAYVNNGDGTITDQVTGLQWQKGYAVMTYEEALDAVKTFELVGKQDWRLPSIKEAYSLILFSGVDVSGRDMTHVPKEGRPFLDTDYFDFEYGSNGERIIDVQMLSSTIYQGTTMGGNKTVFGVNFADGRIKGYPIRDPRMSDKKFTVRFVRGNPDYGKNDFLDNEDGTISDRATGLMWERADSKRAMTWEEALAWAQLKNAESYLGYNDWRLPNAKELQSIVDYTRSLQRSNSAAIDPLFQVSEIEDEAGRSNYPFYWTSTTHQNREGGRNAVYICFGEGLGFFGPPRSARKQLMDVHGAGAQRSDPKTGSAADFPQGHGPQGDVVRIEHYVRLVRDF